MLSSQRWLLFVLAFWFQVYYSAHAIDPTVILPNRCDDIQPRLEIRDLQQDRDRWNVFLLGLKRMQEANSTDPTGYYAIASIHSWPHLGSEGVPQCNGCGSSFCPHTSHLFAIWHRPYMALFERALRTHAIAAASQFPNGAVRRRYITAAQNLRLPYWDWAKTPAPGDSVLPSLFTASRITVQRPEGITEIDNPLFRYTFQAGTSPNDLSTRRWSVRHPNNDGVFETTRNDLAIASVQAAYDGTAPYKNNTPIRCGLHEVMYRIKDMNSFAGSAETNLSIHETYSSLESVHDEIHNAVGGDIDNIARTERGTFYYLDVSAFDPVFWMHHAMVDRMLTMWQVLNPDAWIRPQKTNPTWTIAGNAEVDGSVELSPFVMDANGTGWTGNAARSAASFCYYYSDVDSQDSTPTEVIRAINDLYSHGCLLEPQPAASPPSPPPPASNSSSGFGVSRRAPKRQALTLLANLSQTISNLVTKDGAVRDYHVNLELDAMAVGQPVTIYVFDGQPSDQVASWTDCPTLIARHLFLVPTKVQMDEHGTIKRASVSLNNALIARVEEGQLGGMGNNEVAGYLKRNMEWRVVKSDGCVLDNEEVPGLSISVITADVKPAASRDEFPAWSNSQVLRDVTSGKCGGLSS